MKNILALILVFGLCGCATTAKYEQKLDAFVGQSEDDLIAAWGIPKRTYTMDNGRKVLEFVRKDRYQAGGHVYMAPQTSYESGVIGNQNYQGTRTTYVPVQEPVRNVSLTCRTSFILSSDGTVEKWQHEGNHCVAY